MAKLLGELGDAAPALGICGGAVACVPMNSLECQVSSGGGAQARSARKSARAAMVAKARFPLAASAREKGGGMRARIRGIALWNRVPEYSRG